MTTEAEAKNMFENNVLKWVWENTDFMVDWPEEIKEAIIQELYGKVQ